jgi:hypothetical protein
MGPRLKPEDIPNVPAEAITREHKLTQKEREEMKRQPILQTRAEVQELKPFKRVQWLVKALEGVQERRLKIETVFNIMTAKSFTDAIPPDYGKKMLEVLNERLFLFTEKQKEFIKSHKFDLNRKYTTVAIIDSDEEPDEEDKRVTKESARDLREIVDMDTRAAKKRKTFENYAEGRVERRQDTDGEMYTLQEFIEVYGGDEYNPPNEWVLKKHTSFIFKE